MALADWEDTVLCQRFEIPIRGKKYAIPELGWYSAQKLREEVTRITDLRLLIEDDARAAKGEDRELDDAEQKRIRDNPPRINDDEYLQMLLGGTLAQMREDDVPQAAILHAARCAHTWANAGRDAAEKLWNEGPDPKVLAAEKAALASLTTSLATPPPARSSSTKKPASTLSTSSRKAKGSGSAGTKSAKPRRSS